MKNTENTNLITENLNKTHLAVTILEKETGKYVSKMPIYAEISLTIIKLPFLPNDEILNTVDEFSNTFKEKTEQIKSLISVLVAKYVPESQQTHPLNELGRKLRDELLSFFLSKADIIYQMIDYEALKEEVSGMIKTLLVERNIEFKDNSINQVFSYPLGFLATDHVGYVSYNIENVLKTIKSISNIGELKLDYIIYPLGLDANKINLSSFSTNNRITQDVVFAKLEIEKPDFESDHTSLNLPSMQNPSLADWYMSPSSFASQPSSLLGEDGCETLLPSNLSLHQFNFYQVVRSNKADNDKFLSKYNIKKDEEIKGVHLGYIDEYKTTWYSLGHSLGQILYSLPLAPGETVKLAVIDWSNETKTKRFEDTQTSEFLLHDTHRDRVITETVNAAVSEWQRGGSFEGGLSGIFSKAGAALGISLGGGYATSSGNRNLKADNVQNLNDNFSQQSSVQRELNSTVVVQSRQEEKESIQTRTFSNYNHSHTLTILYYEVLRHFRIVTELKRTRPALLIKGESIDFTKNESIIKYQKVIEQVIIDSSVLSGFNAIKNLVCFNSEFNRKVEQSKLLPDLNAINPLGAIRVVIKTIEATNGSPTISMYTKGHDLIKCIVLEPVWHLGAFVPNYLHKELILPDMVNEAGKTEYDIGQNHNYRQAGQECTFILLPGKPVVWEDIEGFNFDVEVNTVGIPYHEGEAHTNWKIESVIITTTFGDKTWLMSNVSNIPTIQYGNSHFFKANPYKELPKDALDLLTEDERCSINRLKQHLTDNKAYYNTALWLSENPNERAERFLGKSLGSETFFDFIANQAIDVIGDFVVFPLAKEIDTISEAENISAEKLITLPTRGVFAEGKLGHCNISEIIDNTRFWKWEEHPIPIQSPDINPVTPVTPTPQTITVEPSTVPTTINIQQPTPAPDPQGLAGALQAIVQGNMFRDMSMQAQITDLLKNLNDNTAKVAMAGMQKPTETKKTEESSGTTGGSGSTQTGGKPSTTANESTTKQTEAQKESDRIDNTEKKLKIAQESLTPAQQAKVRDRATQELTKKIKTINILISDYKGNSFQQPFEDGDNHALVMSLNHVNQLNYDIQNESRGGIPIIGTFPENGTIEVGFTTKIKNESKNIDGIPHVEIVQVWLKNTCSFHFNKLDEIIIKIKLKVDRTPIIRTIQKNNSTNETKIDVKKIGGEFSEEVPIDIAKFGLKVIGSKERSDATSTTTGDVTSTTQTFEILTISDTFDIEQEK